MATTILDKKQKIKESLKKTKEKRKNQIPKVYQLKISYSNLNKQQKKWLERVFLEAKWLYNYAVADIENRLNSKTEKLKQVEIKTPQGIETREITCLSSQMKQGILDPGIGFGKNVEHNVEILKWDKNKLHCRRNKKE